jgi:hypothetical protein
MATIPQTGVQELHRDIELGQALSRLEHNDDFRIVIKDGYIMDTLVRKSQGMLDTAPPIRQEALEEVQSVNYLRRFLTTIRDNAIDAHEALNSGEFDEE